MHTKNLVSAATIAIALGFSGAAFGQAVTLGTQTVSEADMERVQNRCDDLKNEATAANPGSDNNTAADAEAAPADPAATAETDGDQGTEEGTAGLIELDSITLEQCVEAGLVTN
jgi:hypothetical protein